MENFCIILSLQAGCTIMSAVFITLGFVTIIVNLQNIEDSVAAYVVLLWIILLFITGIVNFIGAYHENHLVVGQALVLHILTFVFWITAALLPALLPNNKLWMERLCVRRRCGETLWLAEQDWNARYLTENTNFELLDCCRSIIKNENDTVRKYCPVLHSINETASKSEFKSRSRFITQNDSNIRKRLLNETSLLSLSDDYMWASSELNKRNSRLNSTGELKNDWLTRKSSHDTDLRNVNLLNILLKDNPDLNQVNLDTSSNVKQIKRSILSNILNEEEIPANRVKTHNLFKTVTHSITMSLLMFVIHFCFFVYCTFTTFSYYRILNKRVHNTLTDNESRRV